MNRKELASRLASRMNVSEDHALLWLGVVLEELSDAYTGRDSSPQKDTLTEQESPAQKQENVEPIVAANAVAADTPVLRSVTPTTRLSIGEHVVLDSFPFRVGRAGKVQNTSGLRGLAGKLASSEKIENELYIREFGRSVNVSREHFQIEQLEDGSYELVDRGSACGTIVSNNVIGGNFIGGRCPLEFGDSIVVGTPQSAIVFEFCKSSGSEAH